MWFRAYCESHTQRLDPQESKPVREYGPEELTDQRVYTATWYLWLRARDTEEGGRHSQAMMGRGKLLLQPCA